MHHEQEMPWKGVYKEVLPKSQVWQAPLRTWRLVGERENWLLTFCGISQPDVVIVLKLQSVDGRHPRAFHQTLCRLSRHIGNLPEHRFWLWTLEPSGSQWERRQQAKRQQHREIPGHFVASRSKLKTQCWGIKLVHDPDVFQWQLFFSVQHQTPCFKKIWGLKILDSTCSPPRLWLAVWSRVPTFPPALFFLPLFSSYYSDGVKSIMTRVRHWC